MSDVADRYRRLAAQLTEKVEAVPAEAWNAPSPCEGWTARDVLRHVLDVHAMMAGYADLSLPEGPSVDDDPVAAWRHVRDAMQDLLDDPARAGREYEGYLGRTTIEQTAGQFLCFDLVIHGWDIARATGGDETIPTADVEDMFVFAQSMGENLRLSGVCGPPVAVPEDADRQTKLLAFLGRHPV
ncbi:TIGR03086 family metal-binding protein [Phytoactinopolyspora halotolerans]|uniref:TIGR03086 family protein n=1 Tax=Phytoactinopolyspora halotolerans TaxID=1981512 RepID=A0A6L9S7U1_9ACTN|nr:TIGR03086 family metal-binding protein [Phytoactinopolyspora halotolerans]NEE01535.1 TIGR03086 family protein [Phytoactinopolyspora halotolerans]